MAGHGDDPKARAFVSARDIRYYLQSHINTGLLRLMNRGGHRDSALPVEEVLGGGTAPVALAQLLIGRSNHEREAALTRYLTHRGIDFRACPFASFEGRGQNLSVDVGSGNRVLILMAHHDAVPGSPGANDNAAAVGILLHLLDRLDRSVPPGLKVRLLFTAAEELFYLGARAYVRAERLDDVVGVLSLELCGIGDVIAVWDAAEETAFLRRVCGAFQTVGLRRDETYHVVGRIPLFGSDHRPFAVCGIPAYGLTVLPGREAEALRRFVFNPMRSALMHVVRRPPVPFDTYHTARDSAATLEPRATEAMVGALKAIISGLA